LDGNGNWGILEVVPKGYVPSYSVNGREITVTNTATLIQTGQMNWPVPVLGGLGALLIAVGVYIILRKRKNNHA
jgi:LPXTG-motif cell wall-anchored protein